MLDYTRTLPFLTCFFFVRALPDQFQPSTHTNPCARITRQLLVSQSLTERSCYGQRNHAWVASPNTTVQQTPHFHSVSSTNVIVGEHQFRKVIAAATSRVIPAGKMVAAKTTYFSHCGPFTDFLPWMAYLKLKHHHLQTKSSSYPENLKRKTTAVKGANA